MSQPHDIDNHTLAQLLVAEAAKNDPLERFIASLSDEEPIRLRSFARETVRLREELLSNVQRMFQAEPREAAAYAEWITRHAHEVGARWSGLLWCVKRWAVHDWQSLHARYSR